jgi:hypothetical protein
MKHLAWHKGIEICRTSAGHIVAVDPWDNEAQRAELVRLLGEAFALDALFFPTVASAREAIDELGTGGLVH